VAELEGDKAPLRSLAHTIDERRNDSRPGPPGDMEPWHGIAMPNRVVAATLRPADNGKEPNAAFMQPRSFLAGGESNMGLCPFARPMILLAVEGGGPHPVFERKVI
jgi:hypothetical protein